VRSAEDVDNIPDDEFPALLESHLDGREFAVAAWIKDGKIQFLNISEYVTLGYSAFVPAKPELEAHRARITEETEKLIEAFDIEFGFIHPEYFLTSDNKLYFGEVAYRPPGFNALELIERAYGFNGCQGMVLAFDPKATQGELDAFFPKPLEDAKGHAGCFGVYPRRRVVSRLEVPKETADNSYFEFHELADPREQKVAERSAFGTHWGLAYFFGEDPHTLRDLLKRQEDLDYYV
jgi:hypothetical protein